MFNKANTIVGMIRRTFRFLDKKIFLLLYKALVRPHLEFANVIWSPSYKKDIIALENVQRRATKLVPHLKEFSYPERLRMLNLPTLAYRRIRGDMIEAFKITHDIYDSSVSGGILKLYKDDDTLRTNRGHNLKLYKQKANKRSRQNFFSLRIVDMWNNLPQTVIDSSSIKCFESRLDKFWNCLQMKFDFQKVWKKITHGWKAGLEAEDELDLDI